MKTPVPPAPRIAQALRQLVGFTRRETRGFVVLLAMLGVLVVLPSLVGRWLAPDPAPSMTAEEVRALDRLAAGLEQAKQTQRRTRYGRSPQWEQPDRERRWERGQHAGYAPRSTAPVRVLTHLTPFDPNALSAIEWQQRGVPADVARRIVSYGRKAGGFRYREQLERIHGLEPRLLARLAPFMLLPSRQEAFPQDRFNRSAAPPLAGTSPSVAPEASPTASATPRAGYVAKPRVVQVFDLNTADTITLMQLRGIGRKRAARIIELRDKLGGFTSPAQLAEVWGLDPELVDSLAKYGHIAPGFQPRTLAVNSASLEELRIHPYVGYRLARVLVAYREQHGAFTRLEDLKQIKLLDEATYQKLVPYVALR